MTQGPISRFLFRPSIDSTSSSSVAEREKWPSRTSFVLASMGGAVGIGNLLRYPSIVAKYTGLQWFVPYLLALFFVGIPLLALEIALGQTHRGGAVVASNGVHKRLRGNGFSTGYLSLITATYYVVIMAWILVYFRHSFTSPLPWIGKNEKFFADVVQRNVPPIKDPSRVNFTTYPGTAVIGETVGWAVLTWVLVYLSIFRGVGLTGRIVYVTMLVPLILLMVLVIRSVSLKNAWRGIRLYIAEWHTRKLANGDIWQDAVVQIFFSVGTGFGYFIAYSSYNATQSNAVQDTLIIALSNSIIEVLAGFAAFGVIGFTGVPPEKLGALTSFDIGFITYPTALAELPGSNAWAVMFFVIAYLLAIDSAFAMIESFATVITDSDHGARLRKPLSMAVIIVVALLLSIGYCTEFGPSLLGAIGDWTTEILLLFSTWVQCVAVTGMYRYQDVISQTGVVAFAIAQGSYILSMVLGVILGQTVHAGLGAGVALLILLFGTLLAAVLSKQPEVDMCGVKCLSSFLWLTSYSGHQLMRDLNSVISQGGKWRLPFFWAPVLRWITAPVLITLLSISYPKFYKVAKDPIHIFSFIIAHIGVAFGVVGFLAPASFAWLVPKSKLNRQKDQYAGSPGETLVQNGTDLPVLGRVTLDSVEDSST